MVGPYSSVSCTCPTETNKKPLDAIAKRSISADCPQGDWYNYHQERSDGLLASWWALAISSLSVILFIVRTALEDRTLRAELTGYDDYAHQVRFRLLPGVW